MSILKSTARLGLHRFEGIRLVRRRQRFATRILNYHNFPSDRAGLRRQCEHIRQFYAPVSMSQIAGALAGESTLPENAVAVTIDDGYRDFVQHAYPVFAEFDIPTTVFLVSDFIDRKRMMWRDEIYFAVKHTQKTSIELEVDGHRHVWTIDKERPKPQGYAISQHLKHLENSQRLLQIEKVLTLLEVEMPSDFPEDCEPLNWDEIRSLARTNVEFGAHTKSHPLLATIREPEIIKEEIQQSRRRIEDELKSPVQHFCYPNGRMEDIGLVALQITRESGFRTAVTTVQGMNRIGPAADAFELKRLGTTPDEPIHLFAELLAGVRCR